MMRSCLRAQYYLEAQTAVFNNSILYKEGWSWMKSGFLIALAISSILAPCAIQAQAPAGATGKCKDGTFTTAATKQGACRGHKGIETWFAAAAPAQKPAPARNSARNAAPAPESGAMPAGATGKCKDGTFTTAATKQGACRGHKGIETWFSAAASPAAAPAPSPRPAAAPASAPVATPAPQQAPARAPARASTSDKTPAPGGGPGLVWVNSESNVYHCYGTHWYGITKAGKYMTEAEAKAAGARPNRGTPCSK